MVVTFLNVCIMFGRIHSLANFFQVHIRKQRVGRSSGLRGRGDHVPELGDELLHGPGAAPERRGHADERVDRDLGQASGAGRVM